MSVKYSPPPIKITASRTTRGPDGKPIPIKVTPPTDGAKPAPAGDQAPAADAAAGDQAPAADAAGDQAPAADAAGDQAGKKGKKGKK